MDKPSISVNKLTKTFKIKGTKTGTFNKIKGIFLPYSTELIAVNNISFEINQGERVAFIGPNGAGKSTTIKMLSGILFPSSGDIKINNLNPQKDRKKLAYQVGTIFGQKPQLWFHLPAEDTFKLFSKIYEIDENIYQQRLKSLVKLLEIKDVIKQPVRKLSLGQRMRCELVLALLHNPKILFLDEPTIGMDIIVKKKMRDLIKQINLEEKTTILLTSHDLSDVEDVCDRVIIINKGEIIYNGQFSDLRKKFSNKKILEITSEKKLILPRSKAFQIIYQTKFGTKIELDTAKMKVNYPALKYGASNVC